MADTENQSAIISVGGDFAPFERQALETFKRTQAIFSRQVLGGSNFSRPLGEISARADEFSKSMAAANARVIAFGASAGVIYAVSKALTTMVAASIASNKALTELNVFLKLSHGELARFSGDLSEVAKSTGKSFLDISKGAIELARQGLSAEETLTRINDAAILARQSGLEMADSVEALTAAVNSFAKTGLTTTQVINKLANVDAQFAVSSRDLAEAIKRVGATADTAGVSIDELVGLITSVQQTTARGGPVIGNALKSILTRVERPEILNQLREVGVEVTNVADNSSKSIGVLQQLAKTFDSLSDSQQSQVAELVGSVYQINILKALLSDLNKSYSTYSGAVRVSSQAQNEAIQRNDEYNKSLEATLNKAKVTLLAVGSQVGNITVGPVLKKLSGALDEAFGDVTKEGGSYGGELGRGILKGLGNFLSGPGVLLLGATIAKLAKDFGGFFIKASKDFFNLNKASKEQTDIQLKIQNLLSHEPQLRDAILNKSLSQVKIEENILELLRQRLAIEEKLSQVATKSAANLLAQGGVIFDENKNVKTPGKRAASGLIPSVPKNPTEVSEVVGALRGGYKPGKIKHLNVKGIGDIVYNDAEKIKDFGFEQPAILPPVQSKAGVLYRDRFKLVHGFDPYVAPETPNRQAAKGLVPAKFTQDAQGLRSNSPIGIMVDELGKKAALSKTAARDLRVPQIKDRKLSDSKILKLSKIDDIANVYSAYPEAQDSIDDLEEAIRNGNKAQQNSLIQDAAKAVRSGLLRDGLEGIEIPVQLGNTSKKLFIDTKKIAAQGLVPFKKIGQGNFANVYDIGQGLVAKQYAPARQMVEREGEGVVFEAFKNSIDGLRYLSELTEKNPAAGIKVAPPIHHSEIDPELLSRVRTNLGKAVFFQKKIEGDIPSEDVAKEMESKANKLLKKKNPYGISRFKDITPRNIKGNTIIDLMTNFSEGLNPKFDFEKFDALPIKEKEDFARRNLPLIGQGSSRLAFELNDEQVLKLAYNNEKAGIGSHVGIAQNQVEADPFFQSEFSDVVPKVYGLDKKLQYLVAEKAGLVGEESFRKITNLRLGDVEAYFDNLADESQIIPPELHHLAGHKLVKRLTELSQRGELNPGDFAQRNLGILKRPGKGYNPEYKDTTIGLLDAGGTRDIIKNFYPEGFVPKIKGYHGTRLNSQEQFGNVIHSDKSTGEGQGQGFYFWNRREHAANHAIDFLGGPFGEVRAKPFVVEGDFPVEKVVPDYELHTRTGIKFLAENPQLLDSVRDVPFGSIGSSDLKLKIQSVRPIEKDGIGIEWTDDKTNLVRKKTLRYSQREGDYGDLGEANLVSAIMDHLREKAPVKVREFEEGFIKEKFETGTRAGFRYVGSPTSAKISPAYGGFNPKVPNYGIADYLRVVDSRGFVHPDETGGFGILSYLGMKHPHLLDQYSNKSLKEILDFIGEKEPTILEEVIQKGFVRRANEQHPNYMGKIPNYADDYTSNNIIKQIEEGNSFAKRKRIAQENLSLLGHGSGRSVYDLGNKTVLKLATSDKGVAQNSVEGDYLLNDQHENIIAKVLHRDTDDRFLISEKADKINPKEFQKTLGVPFDEFSKYVTDYEKYLRPRTNLERNNKNLVSHSVLDSHPFTEGIRQLMSDFEINGFDLGRIDSHGKVDNRLAIRDYGLSRNVWDQFYKKRFVAEGFTPKAGLAYKSPIFSVSRKEYGGPLYEQGIEGLEAIYGGKEYFEHPEFQKLSKEHRGREKDYELSYKRAVLRGLKTEEDSRKQGVFLGPTYKDKTDTYVDQGSLVPLPKRLFHVTTNKTKAIQEGLKSRDDLKQKSGLGLGGGPDDTISFTKDFKTGRQIQRGVVEIRQIAQGQKDVNFLIDRAQKGFRAKSPFYDKFKEYAESNSGKGILEDLQAGVKRDSSFFSGKTLDEIKSIGGTPTEPLYQGSHRYLYSLPLTPEEKIEKTIDVYKSYAYAQEQAGGYQNPLFFSSDLKGLAKVPSKEISLLEYKPRFKKDKGIEVNALGEIRLHEGKRLQFVKSYSEGNIPRGIDPHSIRGLFETNAEYLANKEKYDYAVSPLEFATDLYNSRPIAKFQQHLSQKFGIVKPNLHFHNEIENQDINSSLRGFYKAGTSRAGFEPGNIHLNLSEIISKKHGITRLSVLEQLRESSAARGEHTHLHEMYHYLNDKHDITNQIPGEVFDETRNALGWNHLNELLGISVAPREQRYKLSGGRTVNKNHEESAAEIIPNALLYPNREFKVGKDSVPFTSLPLYKYLRDKDVIPNFGKLYHKDVFFPKKVRNQLTQLQGTTLDLNDITSNARQALLDDIQQFGKDKVGVFPSSLTIDPSNIFELETDEYGPRFKNSNISKLSVRLPQPSGLDRILILRPNGDKGASVVTTYGNDSKDNHRTLDKTKYERLKNKGLIPNFLPGLDEAILREKQTGIPKSLIKIGQDERLKCYTNPQGLGVYNLKDEPQGLHQGISRAVQEGVDPKKYNVPNFASSEKPYESSRLPTAVTDKFVTTELAALKEALKNGTKSFNDIANAVDTLKSVFSLTADSANRAKQVLETAYNTRPGNLKSQTDAGIKTAGQKYPQNNEITVSQNFLRDLQIQRAGYNIAEAFPPVTSLPKKEPPFTPFHPVHGEINKAFEYPLATAQPDDSAAYEQRNHEQIIEARIKARRVELDARLEAQRNRREQPDESQRLAETFQNTDIDDRIAARRKEINARIQAQKERRAQQEQEQQERFSRGEAAASSLGRYIPFSQTRKDALGFERELRDKLNEQVKSKEISQLEADTQFKAIRQTSANRAREKFGNAALAASFVSPVIAGVASEAIGDKTRTSRGAQAVVGGLGNAVSFASLGFSFGGVPGALAGGALGLATSLPDIIQGFTSKLPDLEKEFEKLQESTNRTSDSLNTYIVASEKLGDIYAGLVTVTKGTLARIQSQQGEAFSKLNPQQQSRVSEALSTKGIGGVIEQKALIEQEDKQAELRKNVELRLEKLRSNFLSSDKLVTQGDKVIGSKVVVAGRAGGIGRAPIFEDVLSKEGKDVTKDITNALKTLRGPEDKTIIDILSQNIIETSKTVESLGKEVSKGNVEPFLKFLSTTLEKTGLSKEEAGIVPKGIALARPEAQVLIVKELLKAFSPEEIRKTKEFNENTQFIAQRTQKHDDDFANKLAQASINLGVFNRALEGVNKLDLQNLTGREQQSQARAAGFINFNENFAGPATIESLRNEANLASIQGERKIGLATAGASFREEISQILSQAASSFAAAELQRSQEVKLLPDRQEVQQGALRTLQNIGISNLSDVIKPGNTDLTQSNVKEILGRITKARERINREEEIPTQSQRAQLKLFDEVEKALSESLVNLSSSVDLVNSKTEISARLQDIANKQALDQINLQKKLSIGGGIQNVLSTGGQFNNSLSQGAFALRAGKASGDTLLASQGAFELGSLIQSLGADLPQDLRAALKVGLVDQLKEQFDRLNVKFTSGGINDIADKQIDNFFKREDKQAALLKGLSNFVDSQKDSGPAIIKAVNDGTDYLSKLTSLAIGSGLKVVFTNVLVPDKFPENKILPHGFIGPIQPDQTTIGPVYEPELIGPRIPNDLGSLKDFESITKRNVFGIKARAKRISALENPVTALEFQTPELGVNELLPTPKTPQEIFENRAFKHLALPSVEPVLPRNFNKDFLTVDNQGIQGVQRLEGDINTKAGLTRFIKAPAQTRQKSLEDLFKNDNREESPLDIFKKLTATLGSSKEQTGFAREGIRKASISTAFRASDITSNTLDLLKVGVALETKRADIETKLKKNQIDSLQAEREFTAEIETQIAGLKQKQFVQGKITSDELRAQKTQAYGARIDAGQFKPTDALEAFRDQFRYNSNDYFKDIIGGAQDLGKTMKTSFSEAFKSFIDGSKNAGEAFKSFGLSVAGKVTEIVSQFSTNLLFKGVGSLLDKIAPNAFNAIGNAFSSASKADGGIIKGYSAGGTVYGGSGVRDDVPAMLAEGEYVVRKRSVQKYGVGLLNALNKQTIPVNDPAQPSFGTGLANVNLSDRGARAASSIDAGPNSVNALLKNAFAYNDAKRPTGGYFNVDSQLSNIALSDEDNPQNRIKFQKQQELFDYLRDFDFYEKEKAYAKKAFEKKKQQARIGAYINAAVSLVGYSAGKVGGAKTTPSTTTPVNSNYRGPGGGNNVDKYSFVSDGGLMKDIQHFRIGGPARRTGIDRIPALLTDGEFVVKKNVVQRYGVPFFDALNHGKIPAQKIRRYAEGGFVGTDSIATSPLNRPDRTYRSEDLGEVIAKLGEISEAFKSGGARNVSAQTPAQQASVSSVTNISITVNVDKGGNAQTTSEQKNSQDDKKSKDNDQQRKLSELIKQAVLKTITEQKRPGGILQTVP